ncbi:hypothetical protein [Actinoplanes sp. NPDC051411]|uniref:hypothetical protein n=1 Tax=Actinoplanes sp. NPDC051411 TaxID=3155522 RepID=UPI003442E1E2
MLAPAVILVLVARAARTSVVLSDRATYTWPPVRKAYLSADLSAERFVRQVRHLLPGEDPAARPARHRPADG